MMREVTDVRESQLAIMPVLRYIDGICREYNLRYSLAFGTLIGAVRHKGFIPWDDDIDILMPRPDMDTLIEILKEKNSERFKILNPYDGSSFFAGQMLKVYDGEKTELHEFPHKYDLVYGAYIDVFPIDGIPADERKAKKHHRGYEKYRKILHVLANYPFRKKNDYKKKLAGHLKSLLNDYVRKCSDYHHTYDFETSPKAALLIQTSNF